jgi:hypothetical protein
MKYDFYIKRAIPKNSSYNFLDIFKLLTALKNSFKLDPLLAHLNAVRNRIKYLLPLLTGLSCVSRLISGECNTRQEDEIVFASPGQSAAAAQQEHHDLNNYLFMSPYFETFMEPRNRFQGMNSASLCSLAGRFDNPIPPRFLAPIDSLKIPAQSELAVLKTTDLFLEGQNYWFFGRKRYGSEQ